MRNSDMTPAEFKAIRQKLGLSQSRLAALVGYQTGMSIAHIEANRRPISVPLGLLMRAFDDGYRPQSK
jgi:DNA-binding transcriptional regulator YiaG